MFRQYWNLAKSGRHPDEDKIKMATVVGSSNVWYGGRHPFNHSRLVVVKSTVKTSCFVANASQIVKTITAVKEMNEPIDEIVFQ